MPAAEGRAFDLAALLAPGSVEDFLASAWQRSPLHRRRGDPRAYDVVLTSAELEGFLNAGDLRYPALQLAKEGSYYAAEAYTRSAKHGTETFSGVVDMEKVRAEYRAGATLVLPALQRLWKPLRGACEAIEAELSHPVHANAYLTPGNALGFTPHYDTHDVFVLQIAGRKQWRVFEPPLALPHHSQTFSPAGYVAGAPILELELHPGDLLYLPRGYVHSAATSDSHSLHVTLGVTCFTWIELMNELQQAAKTMPAFREALPAGFARRPELRAELAAGLAQRMEVLRGHAEPSAAVDAFLQRARAARPRSPTPFAVEVVVIGWQTELATPPAASYRIGTENGATSLEHDGRKLFLPAAVRSTLEAIGARTRFRPSDLPRDLDEHATLAFVRFLEGEGFLTRAR